jgi:hypothetical protein
MSFINAEQKQATEKSLYTGVAEMNVDIINPTSAQIAQIYKSEPKETNYIVEYNGQKSTKIDIYLSKDTPSIRTKMTMFISDRERVAASGKRQFINNRGQSCWGMSIEEIRDNDRMKWFDCTTARVAKEGEVDLYNFLIKLFNIDTQSATTNLTLNYPMLLTGNASELNQYVEWFKINRKQNSIKVLLGVKDGKYQDVFVKEFMPCNSNDSTRLLAAAKNELSPFKSYWGNSHQLQPFNPEAIISAASPAIAAAPVAANPFTQDYSNADPLVNPFA